MNPSLGNPDAKWIFKVHWFMGLTDMIDEDIEILRSGYLMDNWMSINIIQFNDATNFTPYLVNFNKLISIDFRTDTSDFFLAY